MFSRYHQSFALSLTNTCFSFSIVSRFVMFISFHFFNKSREFNRDNVIFSGGSSSAVIAHGRCMDKTIFEGICSLPCSLAQDCKVLANHRFVFFFLFSWKGTIFWSVWRVITVGFTITGRVDNVYGDRNLICTLLSVSQMAEEAAEATAWGYCKGLFLHHLVVVHNKQVNLLDVLVHKWFPLFYLLIFTGKISNSNCCWFAT